MALSKTFFGTTDLCLDISRHSCEKNWTHMASATGSYGRPADSWQVGKQNKVKFEF